MTKLRYNRVFKKGIAAILFCIILFSSIVVFFLVAKVQYDQLVSDMEALEATIVDVDNHVGHKGIVWQEIHIEYTVDGIVYNRELKTDTVISFRAGRGARYLVGDKVQIFYDPQNPEIIASPRSVSVGYFWLIFALFFLGLVLFALWWVIKSRQKFLVTQEEYTKEGEELKKSKLAEKKAKEANEIGKKKRTPKGKKNREDHIDHSWFISGSVYSLYFVWFVANITWILIIEKVRNYWGNSENPSRKT